MNKYEELIPAIDMWIKLNNPYPCQAPVNIHLDVTISMDALDTIRQALNLASVAQDMGELIAKAEELSELRRTGSDIWIPKALQVSEENYEWEQELLGNTREDIAEFLINAIEALAKFKEIKQDE